MSEFFAKIKARMFYKIIEGEIIQVITLSYLYLTSSFCS